MPRIRCLLVFLTVVASSGFAQEKSVNPGINKSFEDPNVPEFVERFEREGRDVFDHRNEVVAALGLKPGMAVADVGTGTGLFARMFSPLVGESGKVYAVDVSPKFVEHVEKVAAERKMSNIIGVVCTPDDVRLPPSSIDLVFICDTYHHFEFPAATMRSIHKALKPDGQVVLIDFHRIEGVSSEWTLGHVRAGREVFVQEIKDAGFREVEEKKDLLKESYFVRFEKRKRQPKIDDRLEPLPQTAPAPADNPTTPEKISLGKQLFFDPRLSGKNSMSCSSCHMPERWFGDSVDWNKGEEGITLVRNTQSCLNVGFYSSFFWDGRAPSLEEQALGPIRSDIEMNQDLDELEQELNEIPGYVSQFASVFGTKPNRKDVAKALAAFQRTLVAGPSPFDLYLQGDEDALSADAKRGLELFVGEARCIECHNGPMLSDGNYYRMGISEEDLGREKVTGRKEDRYRFRTPSLRNIAETGPYMHNGLVHSLDAAVTFYYRGAPQTTTEGLTMDAPDLRGLSLSDVPYLVAFLESLSGKAPDFTPPKLPPAPQNGK